MTFLKNQFKWHMLALNYEGSTSDFYLSCFQKNLSVVPLLIIRILIFLGCLSTLIVSLYEHPEDRENLAYWAIYMTNWGVVLINLTSGFAVIVSYVAYLKTTFDDSTKLPWHTKIYWALENSTVTLAIFITVFYYLLLFQNEYLSTMGPLFLATDFLTHATNSVLMLILLLTSRMPMRILHVYFPVGVAVIYMIFSAIYYAAGGTNQSGASYIYEVLDWSQPGPTMILVAICLAALIVIYCVLLVVTALRNMATKSCTKNGELSYFL